MWSSSKSSSIWLFCGILLIGILYLPQQTMAVSWKFPGSAPSPCFENMPIVKIYPDRETAYAAVKADFDAVTPWCTWDGLCYPNMHEWKPQRYDPCLSDRLCNDESLAPMGGFSCIECANAVPIVGNWWDLWTLYWYPEIECGLPVPVQQRDPLKTAESPAENQGAPQICEDLQSNPVNAAIGNKYEPVTDLTASAPGIPLEFRRYYNSTVITNGTLGYGWTHNYGMTAEVATTWTISDVATPIRVKIVDADGKALYFSKIFATYTDGSHFYGESGVKDRLVINTSGQYILRKKDTNLTYTFDTIANDGKLLSISDTNGNTLTLIYTGSQLMQVSDNFGKAIAFTYTGSYISSITDPKGQSIAYTYDAGNNLTGVTYPDTNSIGYAYDANHRLTHKYDLAGSTADSHLIGFWEYNTDGRVSNHYRYLKDSVPQEQIGFTYDHTSTPNTTTLTKSTGTTTYTTEISDGIRVTTGIEGCGSSCGGSNKYFTYNEWNEITDVSQIANGQEYITHYTYDEPTNFYDRVGEVISVTEAYGLPEARTATYTYSHRTDDPFLLTQSIETKTSALNSSLSKVITTAYDTAGNITSKTETGYALVNSSPVQTSYTTTYQYNSYGQLTQIDGPRTDVNDITAYAYYPNTSGEGDNRGQLYSVTNALSQTTQLSNYDANGNVGTITGPNGVITTLTYDARNRLSTVTNQSSSATTQYFYDIRGNLSYVILPEGNRIDYTYNLADKVTEIKDSLNNRIVYGYDVEGNKNREEIYDPSSTLKKYLDYTYDTYNRLYRIVNPDTTYTEYDYDNRNNRTSVRDPGANTTTTSYDTFSRPATVTQPGSIVTTTTYDTQDNPASVTDPRSNATQYTYDDFGRKAVAVSPDTGTTTNTYDAADNLIQSTDARGTVTNYTYDVLNRLTAIRFPADSTQNVAYTYDSTSVTNGKGRLTGRTDPSGTYTFSYDTDGNLIREDKIISGIAYTIQYTYNKNNVLTSVTYPSSRVINYTMDTVQRVSGVTMTKSGTTALASSISYLPFGGITSLTYGNNLILTQTYDNQYRLSSIVAGSVLNFIYTYDANGNITSIADSVNPPLANTPGIPGTYSYPSTSNRLSDITGPPVTTYTYDNNGNIITQNNRTFVYDLSNQITGILDNSVQTAAYTYNGLRQRTRKVVGSDTTIYHYDTQDHLIAETNALGQTLVEYVYLGDMPLAMVRPTEQVYYYHNDHLGTPRVMTNASGAIVWKAAYNAFGNATVDVSSTITNNLRFPGQYYDTESGLHYNWNRYYDPNTGRYITADPIGLEGGVNVFGYVEQNPVNKIDPEGLQIAIPIPPPPVAVPGPYKYKPMPFPSLPSLPEPNNPVSITPPSAGALLAQNIKHWLDVIQGNLNTAQEHANKCNSSSPDNQDQHKWRQEIKAALDKAKKIAEKRLSGKAKAEVLKTIERIANSI